MKKKASFKGFLEFLLILILIALIGILSYMLYLNIPGEPVKLNLSIPGLSQDNKNYTFEVGNFSNEFPQFYPNMRFNHNEISYHFGPNCNIENKQRMVEAFNELEQEVGVISFYKTSGNPDIDITCTPKVMNSINEDYFIAGEGGAKSIIQTKRYNVITDGIILLYGTKESNLKCDWPNIELHELIHVFGFGHTTNNNSLMYPKLQSCDQKLDGAIINRLKELYSEQALPDLYFEDINAVKKGIYLDFDVKIKNSGLTDAKNVKMSVLDEGELVKDFEFGDINYGEGYYTKVTNLRLKHKNPENLVFKIDRENIITEIDEDNNIAKIEF